MVRRRVDVAISWLNGTSMSHAPLAVIACSPTARVLSVWHSRQNSANSLRRHVVYVSNDKNGRRPRQALAPGVCLVLPGRPRSRDSSASSRSSPRDVGRRVRHSSPDCVAGQEEAALPECRSRRRSRHARSTGDRRSSVDRRERRSSGDRRSERRSTGPPGLPTPGRPACVRRPVDRRSVTTSQLSSGRPVTALIRLGMFHVPDRWRTGLVGVTLLNLYQTSWVSVCCKR